MTKVCSKCGEEKPTTEFYKRGKGSVGFRPHCKVCMRLADKNRRDNNPEKERARRKKYRLHNKEKLAASGNDYYRRNKERHNQATKEYYEQNKEWILEKQREYAANNKDRAREKAALRRAAKIERTPLWADRSSIKDFYANCPEGFDVDHIIPLQGETVSGLHVLNNLQYLTARENRSKGNRY